MATRHPFLFSREFKQLFLCALLLLAVVIVLVLIRMISSLRRKPQKPRKRDIKRAKKQYKGKIKGLFEDMR